ncbi:MAG: hypothetical protein GYA24_18950 [Candidatus Lokiarchaeota archaeon]|nr:hypothetical protein [Candidatus Lokiarchaeota archaeon]
MKAMQIRPATPDDAPGVAKVHVDTWRATYARIGGTFIEERSEPVSGKLVKRVALGWKDIREVKV